MFLPASVGTSSERDKDIGRRKVEEESPINKNKFPSAACKLAHPESMNKSLDITDFFITKT